MDAFNYSGSSKEKVANANGNSKFAGICVMVVKGDNLETDEAMLPWDLYIFT